MTEARVERSPNVDANKGGIGIANQARIAGQVSGPTTAEKPINRHAGSLAGDVPQGNVHRRNALEERPTSPEDMQFSLNG